MQLAELESAAQGFMNGLPAQIIDALADVELVLSDDRDKVIRLLKKELGADFDEAELLADCKGIFVGCPTEVEETDTDDNSVEEVTYFPEGHLVLLAGNIENKEEGLLVLMHEIGHALGMNEAEVKEMGLGIEKKEPENGVVSQKVD